MTLFTGFPTVHLIAAAVLADPSSRGLKASKGRERGAVLWIVLAMLVCLSVLIVNGKALAYFDTGGYIAKGERVLTLLHLDGARPVTDSGNTLNTMRHAETGGAEGPLDRYVDGSHSTVYATLLAALAQFTRPAVMSLVHCALLALTCGLAVRVVHRVHGCRIPKHRMFAIPLLVCGMSALPFYVAFLMPDVMTGLLIVVASLLAVYGRKLTAGECVLALIIGSFAAVTHLSHIAIGLLMLPCAVLAAIWIDRRRWWLPPLLVALLPLAAIAERQVFQISVEAVTGSEITYRPFLVARLIDDGVGYRYLEEHCPDVEIPSCALFDILQDSSDPRRLRSWSILFMESEELGSFRLLAAETQARIASSQGRFFRDVITSLPLRSAFAIGRNVARQMAMTSVGMTIPTDDIQRYLKPFEDRNPRSFLEGRLALDRSWIATVDDIHRCVYGVSILVLAFALLRQPGKGLPRKIKLLFALILLGIIANAAVCGALSEPADRYGARVIWLLPWIASLALMIVFSRTVAAQRDEAPESPSKNAAN